MTFDNRKLFTTSAIALSCALALAVPAAAKPGAAAASTAAKPKAVPAGVEANGTTRVIRPLAMDAAGYDLDADRLEAMTAKGLIRPLAGGFQLHNGRYATFAGDITGTGTRIRALEDRAGASGTRIRALAGELDSFGTRIRALWADPTVSTAVGNDFFGSLYGSTANLSAAGTRIRALDGDLAAFGTRIRALGTRIRALDGTLLPFYSAVGDYLGIHKEIMDLVANSKSTWGETVSAKSNGASFENAFSNKMLAKYGINRWDPTSIAGMNEVDLELFLIDWRDNLTLFSGVDAVDHWMGQVNWSPAITHQLTAGTGKKIQIGLIDFKVDGDAKINVLRQGGVSNEAGVHGSAVASLIVGAHDGRGVMGFAPRAELIAYNPFDATKTASWTDVTNGLKYLGETAYVINLSLGVPGYTFHPEWQKVLSNGDVKSKIQDGVFVIAAGNDGITQTQHVNMKDAFDSTFIVVGSVGPDNTISGFSNRPGNVCLTDGGDCKNTARWNTGSDKFTKSDYLKESGLLMNRFIVAPGEFILVDDGQKGVTRVSGTSFATPLVSGAIALIAERWPWMMDKPLDVAHVILSSARDLGEPGTDPVYGRGMLDVEAALAPKFDQVRFKQVSSTGTKEYSFTDLRNTTATQRALWETNKAYFSIFEKLTSTERDFVIPMSTKLAGQTVGTSREQMHAYLTDRLQSALGAPRTFAEGTRSFGFNRMSAPAAGFGELAAAVTATPRAFRPGLRGGTVPFDTGMMLGTTDGKLAMRFGSGVGGADVDGQAGFGLQSDYDVHNGGANPFLGLASGGGYAAADVALSDRVTVSAGFSAQNARRDLDGMATEERAAFGSLGSYRAQASVLSVRYRANDWLDATAGYTMLDEGSALLGTQSLDAADFAHGSVTDAATVGANVAPARGLTLSVSGTLGRTRATDMDRQSLGVGRGGLVSSSFQLALAKQGVFGGDNVRLTLAQPLHVENGDLASKQVQVVDRATGRQGVVVERFAMDSGDRRLVAEAMYGVAALDGKAQVDLFGRANVKGDVANQATVTAGARFRLAF